MYLLSFLTGDHAVAYTNFGLIMVSAHLAHRSLPEEKKHWIRDRIRRVARRRADDK
jgi:hypothetical protein